MIFNKLKSGRLFLGQIPYKSDLLFAIDDICNKHAIQYATFSVMGAVLNATIGSFDQNQQVYISSKENKPFEILSCIGNVSIKNNRPFVHAHIVLSNNEGRPTGGRLFSDTLVFTGEIELRELIGNPLKRAYDKTTGLFLWKSSG